MTNSQSTSLHFTTDAFRPHERVAAWREIYGAMGTVDFEPTEPETFSGEATMRQHPGLAIGTIRLSRTRFSKAREMNDDYLSLALHETGRIVTTARGRDVYLGPGDASMGRSVEAMSGECEGGGVVIRVPTAAIAPMLGDVGAAVYRRIPAGNDALRLLRSYARTLMDGSTSPALARLAITHVYDLVAMVGGASAEGEEIVRGRGVRAARLRAIKEDIAQNLEHCDISVDALARRHGISPRSLQRLFERDGTTLSEFILERRLAHAHRLLSNPRRADKVATIAFTAGFGDISYFYKAFRRRYGLLPTDVRAQVMH